MRSASPEDPETPDFSERPVHLVQLSDFHLLEDPVGQLDQGLAPEPRLRQVLRALAEEEDRPDLLLVTGDLAHRGSLEAYRRIARALAAFDVPWYVIPGNHDDPLHMRQGFGSELTPEVIHAGAWRILLLDSTLTGSPAGAIAPRALRRLDEAFAVYRDDPVLVALHHPPLATGTEWLDAIGLADAPGFRAHLTGRPGFRGTLFGHLHQAFEAHGESGLHLGCPSTAMQFVAGSPAPGIDPSRGGWRSLWLHPDGRLESRIHWVDFPPGA